MNHLVNNEWRWGRKTERKVGRGHEGELYKEVEEHQKSLEAKTYEIFRLKKTLALRKLLKKKNI